MCVCGRDGSHPEKTLVELGGLLDLSDSERMMCKCNSKTICQYNIFRLLE